MMQDEDAAKEETTQQLKATETRAPQSEVTPMPQTRAERRREDRAKRKAMKRAYKNNTIDQSLVELNAQLAEVEKMTAALCA